MIRFPVPRGIRAIRPSVVNVLASLMTVASLPLSAQGGALEPLEVRAAPSVTTTAVANWTNITPTSGPATRSAEVMAPDNLGNVVVFGGAGASQTQLNDTWSYDGATWTQRNPATVPAGRFGAAMAYDPVHHQTVMFGGNVASTIATNPGTYSSNETWIWDGTNWTNASPLNQPVARSYAVMAFDAIRQRVVLFGGSNPNSLGDTWTWDGTNWTQLIPTSSPPARYGGSMSWDSTHSNIVLFGGQDFLNGRYGDTWTWDGTNWTSAASTGPTARYGTVMTDSPGAGGTLLFGGNDFNCSPETWAWNGSAWTLQTPTISPSARYASAASTVPGADQMLLVGGGCSVDNNEIWVYGTPPVAPAAPTGLVASPASSPYEVDLSWSASAGARTYSVKRATTPSGIPSLVAGGILATSFADRSVQPGVTYYYVVTASNTVGESVPSNQASATTAAVVTPVSTSFQNNSYHLDTFNDGGFTSWVEIDPTLDVTKVVSATGSAVVTANIDLWTAQPGFNQDIGLFVSDNGGGDSLIAWKESGGFAGTFSPNAAFVQTVLPVSAGHTYIFKMKWKPNKAAAGQTIYSGAGTAATQFSPSRLTVRLVPTSIIFSSVQNRSYHLDTANDGGFTSWVPVDSALDVMVPGADASVQVSANMDLWTAVAGFNQDIGLFASDNGGSDQLIAWKESGGFAGTFSPNAAFVTAVYPTQAAHSYTFKLKWKPNKSAPGGTLYGAGGTATTQFSPTRVTVERLAPGTFASNVQNASYHIDGANSGDFNSWVELIPADRASITPAANSNALVTANMDLWTSTATFNQDLGIFYCDTTTTNCGSLSSFSLAAWKESGGFAGTFSPNAATAQTALILTAGHTYTFALAWKANKSAPGGVVYGGAGTATTQFSPTSIFVQLGS